MENRAIKEFLKIDNEEDKSEYILDLSHSIQEYVKSGIKNDILNNFQKYASEIKCELTKAIDEHAKLVNNLGNEICDQIARNNFTRETIEQFQQKVDGSMKKVIYLSHLNILSELYISEMEYREEQEDFERITKEFPKLLKIAADIDAKRRVSGNELIEQFNLSDNEYNAITVNCKSYFNLHRGRNNEIRQVTLSPKGRTYLKCMKDARHSYTQSQVDALVTKNCEVVINVIPVSLVKGMPQRICFSGVTPQTERSIQFLFDQAIFNMTRLSGKAYSIRRAGTFEILGKERYDGIREDFEIPILPIKGNC